MEDSIEVDVIGGGLQPSTLVEEESCDAIMDLFNQAKDHVTSVQRIGKILLAVEIYGHATYKSTLVTQLNGNVFSIQR